MERCAATLRREEKILKIADHMALFTVKNDKVVYLIDILPNPFFGIELVPELVEIGDLKMGAMADPPCVGSDFF